MPPWSADRAEDAAATAVAYTIDARDGAPAATAGAARVSGGGGGGGGAGRSRSSGGGGRSSAPRVEIEIRAAAAVGGGWHERLLAAVLQFFGDQKGAFARCFSTMAASPPAASEPRRMRRRRASRRRSWGPRRRPRTATLRREGIAL